MAKSLIRYDLTLPGYFTYPPAPSVATRPMIPRREPRGLYMRGEYGTKPDGKLRPIVAHNTTHLDVPYHFLEDGDDLAHVLNRPQWPADRPCLARVALLGGRPEMPEAYTRDGVTYCETISGDVLPAEEILRDYEALVILTGFGAIMTASPASPFAVEADGNYHVPHLTDSAVERILASGLRLIALDSTGVEPQIGTDPVRFSSEVHFRLLGHSPPVHIVEGLDGASLVRRLGYLPEEGLLHVVARRVNEAGADAAHSRVFLYLYRDDTSGSALRNLADTLRAEEMYG